ncbi:MAG: DEAD/DEAH box helicase [Treponema sp.]|nr:DEAD/DEAH box helicase [Treponema sp.]
MQREGGTFEGMVETAFFTARLLERNIGIPTEIQRAVIPRLLAGENVLFRSATGTGKTFAYLLPLFERLIPSIGECPGEHRPGPRILILAPTLELCSQIKQEADFLLKGNPLGGPGRIALIIGSAAMNRQIDALRKDKPGIVVGNPARLLQLARMGKLSLGRVGSLVLDEGDRLISDELASDTRELIGRVNRNRQTAACSATMSARSRERLLPLMGEPVVTLETEAQEILRERIRHWALFSEARRKIPALRSFLAASRAQKALVFTSRSGQVGNIVSQLQYHGVAAAGLHGDMDKKARKHAFDDFKAGRVKVLVSSDLAARGLDIPGISHVIALDVPADGEAYIHRAGRTARAGGRGIMVTIGDEEELRRFAALEKKLGIIVYPKILCQGRVCSPELPRT